MRRDRKGCRLTRDLREVTPDLAGLRLVMVRDDYLGRRIGLRVLMLIAGEEPPFMTRRQKALAERLRYTVGAEAASSFHHYYSSLVTALSSFVDNHAPFLVAAQPAQWLLGDLQIMSQYRLCGRSSLSDRNVECCVVLVREVDERGWSWCGDVE